MDDSKLYVIFNGNPVVEFDRRKPVPGQQRRYLDNMDSRMDEGIQLGADFIKNPNALQRSQFVANSLVSALLKKDDKLAVAMCTYLAKRMPDLQQIKCSNEGNSTLSPTLEELQNIAKADVSIEFVYDRSYEKTQQEQTIQFFNPNDVTKH